MGASLVHRKTGQKGQHRGCIKTRQTQQRPNCPLRIWLVCPQGRKQYDHTGSWNGFNNLICRDVKSDRTLILLSSNGIGAARDFAKAWFYNQAHTLPVTQLITHVRVIDGNPCAGCRCPLDESEDSGTGTIDPISGETVLDGGGKILAPGLLIRTAIWRDPRKRIRRRWLRLIRALRPLFPDRMDTGAGWIA